MFYDDNVEREIDRVIDDLKIRKFILYISLLITNQAPIGTGN